MRSLPLLFFLLFLLPSFVFVIIATRAKPRGVGTLLNQIQVDTPPPLYDPFNTTYSLTLASSFFSLLHLFSRYIVHTTSYHVHLRSSLFAFLPQPSSLHPEHTYSSPSQRRFSQNNRLPVLLLWDYCFLRIINPRPSILIQPSVPNVYPTTTR